MSKYRNLISRSRVVTVIVFMCLSLLAVSAWSSAARSHKGLIVSNRQKDYQAQKDIQAQKNLEERLQPEKVPIWYATRLFRLIKIEKVETIFLRLTLQNLYKKKINGVQLAVGNVGIYSELMYNEDEMIPPGEIWVELVPIEPDTDTKGITLMAVHFEDGTADGDEGAIKIMEDGRAGEKTQIRRALALIRQALRSPNADSIATLDELLSQIRSLPSDGKKDEFWAGLESGKQRMIAIIDDLRQKQNDHSAYRAQSVQPDVSTTVEYIYPAYMNKKPKKVQMPSDTSISAELTRVVEAHERVVSHR